MNIDWSELKERIKRNIGVNSHSRVGGQEIHLVGKDCERVIELIKQLENKNK
jgi:hypothetical protein